ncbi:DUF5663 domain-containing protein [Mycobacterium sp. ZZG]
MTIKTIEPAQCAVDDVVSNWMRVQLAAALPGLADDELQSLALCATKELEDRVGVALWQELDEAARAEFGRLLDEGEGPASQWLDDHVPGYRAIVAVTRARLVADIVDTVVAADAAVVIGDRSVDELVWTTLEEVERHFTRRGLKYQRDGGGVVISFVEDKDAPLIVVRIRFAGDGELLTLTAGAPDAMVSNESAATLVEFAKEWNAGRWLPKALVSSSEDAERHMLVGEIAIPVPAPTTREHIGRIVSESLSRLLKLFTFARERSVV